MRVLVLGRKGGHGEIAVDLCHQCHALWFDTHESVQLTPGAIVSLFREVRAAPAAARRALPASMQCPRCRATLAQTQDLRHATRFSYWRCPRGHGRFTPFVQFLREKDFIRPLTHAEIERLKAHIRTIRCSGCGAPVDLAREMVCGFCRSPVEALDPAAVATTLDTLDKAEARRQHVDVDALAGAIVESHRNPRAAAATIAAFASGDLISAGVALFIDALRD
jgi:hypothetical protein